MSEPRRVLLVGATGLVGRKVIAQGRNVPGLSLVALARQEMELPRGARMELVLAPVADWARSIALIAPDAVICALGTTRGKAGPDGLARVDRDLVLEVAGSAHKVGTRQFVHVSAVGADAGVRNPYLAIKGEAEQGLRQLGFERLDLLRPSLLRGKRWNDPRPLEALGQTLAPLVDGLLLGRLRRYRSIQARDVARAALQATQEREPGVFVCHHAELQDLCRRWHRDQAARPGPAAKACPP